MYIYHNASDQNDHTSKSSDRYGNISRNLPENLHDKKTISPSRNASKQKSVDKTDKTNSLSPNRKPCQHPLHYRKNSP